MKRAHKKRRGWFAVMYDAGALRASREDLARTGEELLQTKRALNKAMTECDKQEVLVTTLRARLRSANRSAQQWVDRCELWRTAALEWENEARRQSTAADEWRQIVEGQVAS